MEKIGEYLVKRLVGEGGMGKVYEAEERLSKRRVALKVLRPELTRHEDGRRLFLNEMQILAHLEHPNIVRSLASIEADGQLVIVLEFLDGRTLRDALNDRQRLPWEEALSIILKMAEALTCAHSQEPPIIHRDLKPENVMILAGGNGALKVMDFGIAKVLAAAHATNTQSIGTLQYMSPEQIDAKSIDPRSDLYSLGLIFYEMVAGSPPFHSASPRELLNMQCTMVPPDLDDDVRKGMPRGVEELMFALLEKTPDDRPASAAEVVERLSAFRPAERSMRTTGLGRKPARAAPRASSRPEADDSASPTTSERSSGSGDTMHSTPPPKPRAKSTDTVALVERATAPRQLSTSIALIVIIALSLVAGLAVYVLRMRAGATERDLRPAANATASRP